MSDLERLVSLTTELSSTSQLLLGVVALVFVINYLMLARLVLRDSRNYPLQGVMLVAWPVMVLLNYFITHDFAIYALNAVTAVFLLANVSGWLAVIGDATKHRHEDRDPRDPSMKWRDDNRERFEKLPLYHQLDDREQAGMRPLTSWIEMAGLKESDANGLWSVYAKAANGLVESKGVAEELARDLARAYYRARGLNTVEVSRDLSDRILQAGYMSPKLLQSFHYNVFHELRKGLERNGHLAET